MKALLWKDLYTLRSFFLKQGLMLWGVYFAIALLSKTLILFPAMAIMSSTMLVIGCFSMDDSSRFISFALTLPVEKKTIVTARYVLMFGSLLCFGVGVSVVTVLVNGLFSFGESNTAILAVVGSVLALYWLVLCVVLPFFIAIPAEKARLWMIASMIAPLFLGALVSPLLVSNSAKIETMLPLIVGGIGLAIVMATVGSYTLSQRLFSRREF